jgi:transcription elongation factor GreA
MSEPMARATFLFLKQEQVRLRQEIIRQTAELRHAIDTGGGTHDNAMYDQALHTQGVLLEQEKRISRYLERPLIIEDIAAQSGDSASYGSVVTILELEKNEIRNILLVGQADIEYRTTQTEMVSRRSPLGQQLFGKSVGEQVEVDMPSGLRRFLIVEIKPHRQTG